MQKRDWNRWQRCDDECEFNLLVEALYHDYALQVRRVFLQGELGAGKTTFARKWLKLMGVKEKVRSPTFSVVESYEGTQGQVVHHFDLYRFSSADEIYCLGMETYINEFMLVEWPEHGMRQYVEPDLTVEIKVLPDEGKREMRAFLER
jgi:tRNA threonylcarbamoyladenosine biosynthesis protein TsaE